MVKAPVPPGLCTAGGWRGGGSIENSADALPLLPQRRPAQKHGRPCNKEPAMDNEQNRYPMREMFFGIPAGLRGEKQPVFSPLVFVILPAQLLYRPAVP